ncbi:MAG TPA: hypothetical protein DEB40_09445 [Elusimicrobia bacterium]|nr:hypothetical protein [Elusimicrobiota bacterium]HBT61954.1 hypothetical protein [Elusimicrobiota bacterium]
MSHWVVPLAGAAAIVFAALMIFQRSLYAAAVCLLAVLLQAAVLFYACGARLLAFLLILIYAGAVAVLIVVAISVASVRPAQSRWSRMGLRWPLITAGFLLPALEAGLLMARRSPPVPAAADDLLVGRFLFGPYAAATEAVGLLMLFAALAVVCVGPPSQEVEERS